MLGYTYEIVSAQSDGAALSNSVAATSIISQPARLLLPGNFFSYVGQEIIVEASGRVSNIVTTPGTLNFQWRLGPTSAIIAAQSPSFQLNAVAKTNVTWWLRWAMTVRSLGTGTSATLMHTGWWSSESVVGSPLPAAGGAGMLMIPASAPAVGTGFDSTIGNISDLQAQFSIANAGNAIQCHQYRIFSGN